MDRATNRLTGKLHDVAGNLLESTATGAAQKLAYLDQGHIREVRDGADALLYRYYYDADGQRRIKAKAVSGNTSITANCSYYFYEGEDLIGEQDRGLQVQPPQSYDPKFLLLDHLGTTRGELTFPGGTPTVAQVYDTMPYGELINGPAQPNELVLFTGKPRDSETSLDYFGFRQLQTGRWMSPDPLISSANRYYPQSWNGYAYVRNRPLVFTDALGLELRTGWEVTWTNGGLFEKTGGKPPIARTGGSSIPSSAAWGVLASQIVGWKERTIWHDDGNLTVQSVPIFNDVFVQFAYNNGVGDRGDRYHRAGDWRGLPDFYSFNVNVPWPNGIFGHSAAFTIDRNGEIYVGFGPSVGKSGPGILSGSLTAGWLNQNEKPKEEELKAFLTGSSFNFGAGFIFGMAIQWSPYNGSAIIAGAFWPPQVGGSYAYSKICQ